MSQEVSEPLYADPNDPALLKKLEDAKRVIFGDDDPWINIFKRAAFLEVDADGKNVRWRLASIFGFDDRYGPLELRGNLFCSRGINAEGRARFTGRILKIPSFFYTDRWFFKFLKLTISANGEAKLWVNNFLIFDGEVGGEGLGGIENLVGVYEYSFEVLRGRLHQSC